MPKMIEITAAEYERLNDCIREDGLEMMKLRAENERLRKDVEAYQGAGMRYEQEISDLEERIRLLNGMIEELREEERED